MSQTQPTILVIDDDVCMRDLLRLHLSNAGYDVSVAEDAVDAGHSLLKQRPDLILADIEMPYMDGLEFLQAVKADDTMSSVPVILVTGSARCRIESAAAGRRRVPPQAVIRRRAVSSCGAAVRGPHSSPCSRLM